MPLKNTDFFEDRHYDYCLSHKIPYFGRRMAALQGNPVRHAYMDRLVSLECRNGVSRFNILEIGSWAGGSAITWALALLKYNKGDGVVLCVDPWCQYFDSLGYSEMSETSQETYSEMERAMSQSSIFNLFLHNVKSANCDGLVIPVKGFSDKALPLLGHGCFDLVYVDGDHSYGSVLKDLHNSAALVSDGGVLCGDDLELQAHQIDLDYARKHKDKDYICDLGANEHYHPGVSLAVHEFFGEVSSKEGFWAMRRRGDRWEKVKIPDIPSDEMAIPGHFALPPSYQKEPSLVEWRYKGYGIVKYQYDFYALSHSLGPVDLLSLDGDAINKLRKDLLCFVGDSLAGVKSQIDNSGFCPYPELLESGYKGFNILRYKKDCMALSISLGHVDLTQTDEKVLDGYVENDLCVTGSSPEEVKNSIDKISGKAS